MPNKKEQNKTPKEKSAKKEYEINIFAYLTLIGLVFLLAGFIAFLFVSRNRITASRLYLLGGILILILILGLIFVMKTINKREKHEPDYRAFFTIGIIWLPFGIITKNPAFFIMGLSFAAIGIINKDKWKKQKKWNELNSTERKIKSIIIIMLGILLFAGAVAFLFARFSGEDSWMCQNGEWIKHGVPSASKPTSGCNVTKKIKKECSSYIPENCPSGCAVCPPCMACSSISCQSEEFCKSMGIDGSWYENIKQTRVDYQIKLTTPVQGQKISSPLVIEGEARGTWFFEGSFPVILTDWDGLIIAQGQATAQSDWMTQDFVEFKAELEFETPTHKKNGSLILKKDNPSGLPENDDALEIPVIFE